MKKFLLPILLFTMFVPFVVKAESKYLYDVLKEEAENGGVASEYTGAHQDSFNGNGNEKVYHWYLPNSSIQYNEVLNKNNVIFAGFCWQIIRTTDTGGVKIIYNGEPIDGNCNVSNASRIIGTSKFNPNSNSLIYSGYMYNPEYAYSYVGSGSGGTTPLFGNSVRYNNGVYTLVSTRAGMDYSHRYSCGNTSETCSTVRYYFYSTYYIEISNGKNGEEVLYDMLYKDDVNKVDSTIKAYIDNWYRNNMIGYSDYLEDTIYCNDRSIYRRNGWDPDSSDYGTSLYFNSYTYNPSYKNIKCENDTDKFSLSNPKAKLTYPIGLMSPAEMRLLNNNHIATIYSNYYWLSSPSYYNISVLNSAINYNGDVSDYYANNEIGVRPAVSLKMGTQYSSGDGSKDNPYVVKILNNSDVTIINDDNNGTVSIDKTEDVEETSQVDFDIKPKTGYKVYNVIIKDNDGNDIEYVNDNNHYTFTMPACDVKIMPSYERVKNSVNVEIMNETDDITVSIDDMSQVEYEEVVNFKVNPIKGYKVSDVKIVDTDGNEIEYNTTDKKNYTFTMPASDVTIIPSYERVSNSVSVDDNKNTKEFIIEVNDSKAVVYEDTVRFIVTPDDGYEVDKIEIIDKEENKIEYRKTDKENEYEFTMPDTDVVITPTYRKIESINVPDTLKNPNTGTGISIIIIFMLIISSITYIIFKRKKKYIMK